MKNTSFALILGILSAAGSVLAADTNKWDITKLDATKLPPAATNMDVTYDKDIKPLFQASCFGCHGDRRQRGGLRLDSLDATLKGGDAGKIVTAGGSDKSLLVMAISQLDKDTAMPPKFRPRRPGAPGGPGGPGGPPGGPGAPPGGPAPSQGGGLPPPDGQGAPPAAQGGPPGGPGGQGGPGGGPPGGPRFGPPSKPLTADQVALVRAWIDQGAK